MEHFRFGIGFPNWTKSVNSTPVSVPQLNQTEQFHAVPGSIAAVRWRKMSQISAVSGSLEATESPESNETGTKGVRHLQNVRHVYRWFSGFRRDE
jgi:hypothetical protein